MDLTNKKGLEIGDRIRIYMDDESLIIRKDEGYIMFLIAFIFGGTSYFLSGSIILLTIVFSFFSFIKFRNSKILFTKNTIVKKVFLFDLELYTDFSIEMVKNVYIYKVLAGGDDGGGGAILNQLEIRKNNNKYRLLQLGDYTLQTFVEVVSKVAFFPSIKYIKNKYS